MLPKHYIYIYTHVRACLVTSVVSNSLCQAPLFMGLSRQEYWSGLPFPSPVIKREVSEVKSLSRVRLCDPMDCSLPGSSIHGILQARVLEWGAIAFSRGSSRCWDQTQVSCIPGRCFNPWATREAITWATNLQSYEKQKSVLLIGLAVFFKENMKDTGLTDKSF